MQKALLLIAFLAVGCGSKTEEPENTSLRKEFEEASLIKVDTIHLERGVFKAELISNGKLRAERRSDLRFEVSGVVSELTAENGNAVASGQVIASLDHRTIELQLERAVQQLERSKVDLHDAMLGLGYDDGDTTRATLEHRRTARLRSGYDAAQTELRVARMNLERSSLRAPFAGKMSNLKTKQYEQPKGEMFCTIIDDRSFDVEFPILEGELDMVRIGTPVKVSSFIDPSQQAFGTIRSINPMVDDKGQILISARVSNPGDWLDGMNVKIYVSNQIANKLVVPKSAVMIRDNLQVLFRMSPDGHSIWTYVWIEASNSTSHAVVANTDRGAELSAGDVVVVSGNLNLADNVPIIVAK